MSEFEAIPLEATFNLPAIQFLNDLSYLKAKDNNEKVLNARITKQQEYS